KARLRPVASSAPWTGRESLRLTDGTVGLDYYESDLRVLRLADLNKEGPGDVLAVSLGGGKNAARLLDLGRKGQAPKSATETDALPLAAGCEYLLRVQRGGQEYRYLL